MRKAGGCAICGDEDVVWVDARNATDPSYRAVCRWHLAYAVSTIFIGENPGLTRERPSRWEPARQRRKDEPLARVVPRYADPRHGDLRGLVDARLAENDSPDLAEDDGAAEVS